MTWILAIELCKKPAAVQPNVPVRSLNKLLLDNVCAYLNLFLPSLILFFNFEITFFWVVFNWYSNFFRGLRFFTLVSLILDSNDCRRHLGVFGLFSHFI